MSPPRGQSGGARLRRGAWRLPARSAGEGEASKHEPKCHPRRDQQEPEDLPLLDDEYIGAERRQHRGQDELDHYGDQRYDYEDPQQSQERPGDRPEAPLVAPEGDDRHLIIPLPRTAKSAKAIAMSSSPSLSFRCIIWYAPKTRTKAPITPSISFNAPETTKSIPNNMPTSSVAPIRMKTKAIGCRDAMLTTIPGTFYASLSPTAGLRL